MNAQSELRNTYATKTQLVFHLHLIGWEGSTSLLHNAKQSTNQTIIYSVHQSDSQPDSQSDSQSVSQSDSR